jgi:arylsulfatase A-like enzyme
MHSYGVLSLALAAASAAEKPHILFVVVDDHGFRDNGYSGSRINTPTIDRLRAGGVHLDQYYAQKVCSPTRQAIHTGRYPHRNGMQTPFCGGSAEGLNLNETLLPQLLGAAGYARHAVGKWHLGFTQWAMTPTYRGYESFLGYYGCAETYFTHEVAGALDFHDDARPRCGANCSVPGTCTAPPHARPDSTRLISRSSSIFPPS